MIKTDSIIFGLLIGLAVPFVTYGILLEINDLIIGAGFEGAGGKKFGGFSQSLLGVIAVVANIIPFQIFVKRHYDDAMRGIIFPTLFYAFFWAFYFDKLSF
ncbi:MAG: hypothetical protein AAF502_19615 [Bacteroidota bacterium]